MRILLTATSGPGHLNPMVAFARDARARGHDVAVATGRSVGERLAALGVGHLPAGAGLDHPQVRELIQSGRLSAPGAAELIFGLAADLAQPEMREAVASFKPDLVFSELFELSGPAEAERLGIPSAVFGFMGTYGAAEALERVREPLNRVWERAGLETDPVESLTGRPWVFGSCPRLVPPEVRRPARSLFCSPESEARDQLEEPPAWVRALEGTRSVYFTLGTAVAPMRAGYMETLVEGLAGAELDAVVVTTGPMRDPASFGPLPAHVRVERYVPQDFVLSRVSAAVLHAGYGSTSAAMCAGLPLVVVPFGADQPGNAQACVRAGVGLSLDKETMTPESVRIAIERVIDERAYRSHAHALKADLDAQPTPGEVLELIIA